MADRTAAETGVECVDIDSDMRNSFTLSR